MGRENGGKFRIDSDECFFLKSEKCFSCCLGSSVGVYRFHVVFSLNVLLLYCLISGVGDETVDAIAVEMLDGDKREKKFHI